MRCLLTSALALYLAGCSANPTAPATHNYVPEAQAQKRVTKFMPNMETLDYFVTFDDGRCGFGLMQPHTGSEEGLERYIRTMNVLQEAERTRRPVVTKGDFESSIFRYEGEKCVAIESAEFAK